MALIRAIVETVDTANGQADIRPLDHPAALFTACPVIESCAVELLATDATVLAQTFDDGTAIIMGAYGSAPRRTGYVCLQDQKASGTSGGTFSSGAWRTRTLNTEQADDDNLCSLSSNRITLAAGTYRCHIACPAYDVEYHQARLYNVTDSAVVLMGNSEYCWASDATTNKSLIVGQFTIAASKALEVQHRCYATRAGSGFGVGHTYGVQVFTQAQFWRLKP